MKALLLQHNTPRVNYAIPLGLAYIGAALKKRGVEVKVIDAAAPYASYSQNDLIESIKDYSPRFVGMTITTLFAVFAYDLIKALKQENVTIVAGGPHPTLFPDEVLNNGAGIVARGEGEFIIDELVDYFEGKKNLADIAGISYISQDRTIRHNPQRPPIAGLDSLPLPAKDIFNIRDYVRNTNELRRFACIISSRGCVGRCSFCSRAIFGGHFRFRSHENILSEIAQLHNSYGITHFSFLDDVFTAHKKRVIDFCKMSKEKLNFKFRWDCVTRVDCVTDELLWHMRDAGCRWINYGVESANPQTLKILNKRETIEEIERCIIKTKEAGIDISVNFMWGYPWEGFEDFINTRRFIKRINRYVGEIMPGGILVPFPDTQIYENYKDRFGFERWWLDPAKFTGSYRQSTNTPFFRIYLFDDQGQFEGGGFFKLDARMMKRIESLSFWLGWHNLRKRHGFFTGAVIFIMCYISWYLYRLSPDVERLYSDAMSEMIYLKNRIFRKRI